MFTSSQRREFSSDEINRTKTKIWIHDLKVITGLKTVSQIKEKFDPNSSFSTWDNYEKGIHSPTFRKGIDRVAMMAEMFPGSDQVFNCVSWEVLKLKKISEEQLKLAIEKLGPPISELILYGSVFDPAKIGGHPIDFSTFCDELRLFPDFTTLRGLVLLLALGKFFESDEMWNSICTVYSSMVEELLFHQTMPFYPEVFEIIDNYALRRERMAVNKKPDLIFTSWKEQLPNYKQNLIEHYSAGLELSYFMQERTQNDFSQDSLYALSETLVEIVWQCGWALNFNVSELWGPLMDRFRVLPAEIENYHKLTNSEFFDFFQSDFHNLFQKNEEEPPTTSSYTPPFPSILQPGKISENARPSGYPAKMEIFSPYLTPDSSEN